MNGKYINYDENMDLEIGDIVRCFPYVHKERIQAIIIKVCDNGEYIAHENKYGVDVRLDPHRIEKVFKITGGR